MDLLRSVPLQLVPYQTCRSREGWTPVRLPSESVEGRHYTVLVSPWSLKESICECRGYEFRGVCKHQERAAKRVCGWDELADPQQQNPDERHDKVCPRCGGPTRWEVNVVED